VGCECGGGLVSPDVDGCLDGVVACSDWVIYRHFRDLLRFKNTGDPLTMLRSVNPREAALVDAASGASLAPVPTQSTVSLLGTATWTVSLLGTATW
jgi:hypothetical protein